MTILHRSHVIGLNFNKRPNMLKPKLEEPQRAAGISADSVRG